MHYDLLLGGRSAPARTKHSFHLARTMAEIEPICDLRCLTHALESDVDHVEMYHPPGEFQEMAFGKTILSQH